MYVIGKIQLLLTLNLWSVYTRAAKSKSSRNNSPCFAFPSPLLLQHGFGFLHLFLCAPSLLSPLSWVEFPSETHPDSSNPHKSICYFPSPLLPIVLSIHPQLSCLLHLSSSLTHHPPDLRSYIVINLTVWYTVEQLGLRWVWQCVVVSWSLSLNFNPS